jgi:hypothetical protein
MEGFSKCGENNNYIYFKCKNQKTKNCKSIVKLCKHTMEIQCEHGHNNSCRKSNAKKKEKANNNSGLANIKLFA